MTEHRAEGCVPADHPCLAGHFPGNPIVPGVVLLECVAAAMRAAGEARPIAGIPNVKFVQPLRPDVAFSIHWVASDHGLRFRCESGPADAPLLHAQGVFSFKSLPDNAGLS